MHQWGALESGIIILNHNAFVCRSVVDPRDGTRKALKKMPNVFQNTISCRRVYRELKMLTALRHDNVSAWHPFTVTNCGSQIFKIFTRVPSLYFLVLLPTPSLKMCEVL